MAETWKAFLGSEFCGAMPEHPNYWEINGRSPTDNARFSVTGHCGEAVAQRMAAAPELLSVAKRFCEMIDDDPERFNIAEPSCNECTMGCTPIDQDNGLCAYHTARSIIFRLEGAKP